MINEYNNKHNTLKGLIKHDRISSIMKEAVDSPVGSTSRKRARNIISVLKKANLADGVGGPGYGYQNYDGVGGPGDLQTPAQTPTDYSRLVVFPSAPAADAPKTSSFTGGAFEGYQNPFTLGGIKSGLNNFVSPPGPTQGPEQPTWRKELDTILSKTQPQQQPEKPSVPMSAYGGQTPGTVPPGWKPQDMGPVGGETPTTGTTPQTGTAPTTGTTPQTGTTPIPGTTPTTETTPQFPQPGQKPTGLVQQAVNQGIGGSMFAMQVMSDPSKLKEALGIDIPTDKLPSGPTLSANINELSDTLKKQYHLDDLLNQKQSMVETGVTLERDLNDYIRGRDEYLNQTQGMITSFQDQMSKMDLSNPNTAKQADNYMNYLYTLRGRQNQRYIDFLNSGITQYNRNLTEVSNNYDKALSAYQYELQQKSAITTDEFNMYNTALQEMYKNAEDAPMKKLQMLALQKQINATASNTITDGAGNSLSGTPLAKDLGTINNLPTGFKVFDDKTGDLSSSVNSIEDTINNLSAQAGVTPYSVVYAITGGMKNKLGSISNYSDAVKTGEKYMGMVNSYFNQAADQQTAQQAQNMANEISSSIGKSITDSLKQDKQAIGGVSDAVNSLTNSGWFGTKKLPSREQFISDYQNIDKNILNSLYTWVSDYKTQNAGASSSNIIVLINGVEKKLKDLTPDEIAEFVGKATASQMYSAFVTPA